MGKLVDRVVRGLKRYPLRTRVYPLAVLVLGYLVYRGDLDVVSAETIGTAVAVVLGVKETERHTVPVIKGTRRRRKRR